MDPHAKLIPLRLHPMGFIEAFLDIGMNLDELLRRTGIHKHLLDDKDAKISYAQQTTLVKNGMDLFGKPGVGLLVGQRFGWNFHGAVGGVIDCSPSLREAGEAFHQYLSVAQPAYAMYPREPLGYILEKDLLIYPLRGLPAEAPDPTIARFEMEYTLAVTLRLWDLCGNKSVADPSIHVSLDYPEPEHAHLYRALPCTSVRFGAEQSHIAAHTQFVFKSFRAMRKHAFDRVIELCEEELRQTDLETSFATKVRWHLYKSFNRQTSVEDVAEILHLTPRTLTRRLAAEGTTFRNIVNDVRMEMVQYHLRHSKLSIDEIAELMGFSCASSLRRAVRNWSGEPASTARPRTSSAA